VFDSPDSPVTQTFGLGIFEELTAEALDVMERFFFERGAAVAHEVSPFAGVAALNLLCERGYRPIELSSVLYQVVEQPAHVNVRNIRVRLIGPEEAPLWAKINALGWTQDHPEHAEFMEDFGKLAAGRSQSRCFLAEFEGKPAATGSLTIHERVALFGGAATVPEFRCRGLQAALLEARMSYAHEQGCNLAMMVAEVGSNSQRNAERKGFRVAYTRTKWRLPAPA
jgi:GNAT superfamily N-acetyltransferase